MHLRLGVSDLYPRVQGYVRRRHPEFLDQIVSSRMVNLLLSEFGFVPAAVFRGPADEHLLKIENELRRREGLPALTDAQLRAEALRRVIARPATA